MNAIRMSPMVKVTGCFLLGILLARYGGAYWGAMWVPAWIGYLGLWLQNKHKISPAFERSIAICIYLCWLGLGAGNYRLSQQVLSAGTHLWVEQSVLLSGVISSEVKTTPYGKKAYLDVFAKGKGNSLSSIQGKLLIYTDTRLQENFQQYDTVYVYAQIKKLQSRYPGYERFLRLQGIQQVAYVKRLQRGAAQKHLRARAFRFQQQLSHRLSLLIPDSVLAGMAQAMLVGNKQQLSEESRTTFTRVGASHLLAISGLHIGVIFLLLQLLFQPFQLFPHGGQIRHGVTLIVLFGYAMVTGASPAVLRAVLILGTILVFRMCYLRYHILNLIAFSAFLQLLWEPALAFQISFQLSYAAVLGIVTIYPYLERSLKHVPFWLKPLYAWIGISLCATLTTLPFTLWYFEQFPTYFLLTNVLISLLSSGIIWVGFLLLMASSIPVINVLLGKLCYQLLSGLDSICRWIAQLPYAVLDTWDLQHKGWVILLMELVLTYLLWQLPYWVFKKKE